MRIYPVSLIIFILLILFLIYDWKKGVKRYFQHTFILYVSVVLFSNIGNFIEIGTFSLTNRAFLSVYTFFVSILAFIDGRYYNKRIIFTGIGLYICVLIGYVSLAVMPYTGGVLHLLTQWDGYVAGVEQLDYALQPVFDFETIFKIVHFPIVLAVAYKAFLKPEEKQNFLSLLLKISNYILLYSLIEFIAIKIFSAPISSILHPLFGESDATFVYTDRLQGLFKEASHYAGALFIWGLLNIFQLHILQKQKMSGSAKRWCYLRFVVILVLLIASTSFVGLLYVALLIAAALFYCTKIDNVLLFGGMVAVCLFGFSIISNPVIMQALGMGELSHRIEQVFETFDRLSNGGVGTVSSEGARFTSIFSMLQILLHRPLFGVGAGVTDAHSTLFATLGNLGIVGTCFLAAIYVQFGKISNHRLSFYAIIIVYLSFAGSFGGIFDFQYPMMFFFAGYAFQFDATKGKIVSFDKNQAHSSAMQGRNMERA